MCIPLGNFGIGQGADGFAINTNHLKGIKYFYNEIVKIIKNYFYMMIYGFLIFYIFLKKIKYSLCKSISKKIKMAKQSLIYKTHVVNSGLVSTYGNNIIEAVKKRDQIAAESFKYMQEKTKDLTF